MKVLIIHNAGRSDFPSGELVVVNEETKALRKRRVEVFCHIEKNDKFDNIFSFRTLFTGINLLWSYSSYYKTIKLIDKFNPDIVHFHSILPLVTASAFFSSGDIVSSSFILASFRLSTSLCNCFRLSGSKNGSAVI